MKPLPPSPRVALYTRVSTADQTLDLQERELRGYAKARGWTKITIYADVGTGKNGDRPSLKRLLSDVRQRKCDLVLCWRLDRLFRSIRHLLAIVAELEELGVGLLSLKDNIDLTSSTGRLMLHIISAFAQFEADLLRERTLAGLAAARARGVTLGRPKTRDDSAIRALRKQGLSIRAIAQVLNTSTASVQRALK